MGRAPLAAAVLACCCSLHPRVDAFVAPSLSMGSSRGALSLGCRSANRPLSHKVAGWRDRRRAEEAATTLRMDVAAGASGRNKEMKYFDVPYSDLRIPKAILGGMMFGSRTSEKQAIELMDEAYERGINMIDTAEVYPLPYSPMDYDAGESHRIIGRWMKSKQRSDIIISTKVCGRSTVYGGLRSDPSAGTALTRDQIFESVEQSLIDLDTDYIDVLQLHWPDRYIPAMGEDQYDFSDEVEDYVDFEVQLMALQELIEAGKIRYIAVCDETSFGILKFLEHAEWDDLPRILWTHNTYNLLHRARLDMGLTETLSPKLGTGLPLLANSPVAGGVLTGKYARKNIQFMEHLGYETRLSKYPGFQVAYKTFECSDAVEDLAEVAMLNGMTLQDMALRWCFTRPLVSATVIGPRNVQHLEQYIDSLNADPIPQPALIMIENIYARYRDPTMASAEV